MEREKSGIEILFEQVVKTTIHMTPPQELMREVYTAMWCISSSESSCGNYNFNQERLSPERVTALSILSRMGLLNYQKIITMNLLREEE